STSALAEELIEEGLRLRRHPLVVFRDGATGRRAGLVGGPDIWEVVGGLVGGDVRVADRVARAVELFGLSSEQVTAALDYYAAFSEETDAEIAANQAAAEEAELLWRRRQQLLAG
ncbi:MAG: CopG family transcriptional regulator, partial [Candidatus Dormiibacterota bacterium]